MTKEQLDKLRIWTKSEEGQKKIKSSIESSKKMVLELRKARQVDPAKVDKQYTV